jgi:phosphoglycerol transferase
MIQAPAKIAKVRPVAIDKTLRLNILTALGQASLIGIILFVALEGWRRDFYVPLVFSSDSLVVLMQTKSTMDHGWWWSNPMLSAPSTFHALAFPANANVDQFIVFLISRFTHSVGLCINLAWICMLILSGLTATWCLRKIGIARNAAIVAGTLFAISPYALYRQIDHLVLVTYLVPFPAAAALLLITGRPPDRWYWRGSFGLLAGCALLGFNYVYYAFFGSFLLIVASVAGYFNWRDKRILFAGATCVALIGLCTLLNLAPSLYVWHQEGKPIIIRDKVPAEAEVYGLKLRQLVSPVFGSSFPPFRRWTQKEAEAQFPLETENMVSRLGFLATLGFLGVLGALFVRERAGRSTAGQILFGSGQLTLAAVLLGTVGGFGSLFNLLVTSEIRAYNRICAFLVFFAIAAVALALDGRWMRDRWLGRATLCLVLAIGILDQTQALRGLNTAQQGVKSESRQVEAMVRRLEDALPGRAMVYQLPFTTYLNDSGRARMKAYDHLRPYLVSRTIHWSYPALSNAQVNWQRRISQLDAEHLARQLASDGFAAILVDRYGYTDDGKEIADSLQSALGGRGQMAANERYVAFDIRPLKGAGKASSALEALSAVPIPATVGMAACPGEPVSNIDQLATVTGPVWDKTPHISLRDEFRVLGWAIDQSAKSAAADVDIIIDGIPFPSLYGTDRSDVAESFKSPAYRGSGFTADIPARKLGIGRHVLVLRVMAANRTCYFQSRAAKIVVE